MRYAGYPNSTFRLGSIGVAALMVAAALGCNTPPARGQAAGTPATQRRADDNKFPDSDAVLLRREQHWTLATDGTVRRRDVKVLRIKNSRPIRKVADPRIDFVEGEDKVIIHQARTTLASGEVLPVPEYSFNFAALDEVAGWPEYASWQQQVVSFSGIEPNAVIELDYEVVTPSGVMPWIWGDVRIDDDYPTVERVLSVTVPAGTGISHRVDRMKDSEAAPSISSANGTKTYTWRFRNLPGTPAEALSFPWQQRCGRFRFTTCPDLTQWTSTILARVEKAVTVDERIAKSAEKAVEDGTDTAERVGKLAKKLHDSFNVVTSLTALRRLKCRSASEVFDSNYGNSLEAAALYASALKGIGVNASFAVGVDAREWDENVPTLSAFSGVIVRADIPDQEPIFIDPTSGVFKNPGQWGRHWMLNTDAAGVLQSSYVYARGEKETSDLTITGKIVVDNDGVASGQLRLRLTGAFFDPDKIDSGDAQKALVTELTGRVLSGLEVTGHSVVTLSDEAFRATVDVSSGEALKRYGSHSVLRLGSGPAFLKDFPLPLRQSNRKTDVRLASRVREKIDIVVELPDSWEVSVAPASHGRTEGAWGFVSQDVEINGQNTRFRRAITINSERIAPTEFAEVRQALNALVAEQSLLLVFSKASNP